MGCRIGMATDLQNRIQELKTQKKGAAKRTCFSDKGRIVI